MRFLLAILLLLLSLSVHAQQGQGMSQAVVVSSCGGGVLPSGAVNQLTMDPQGRLCQSGIGSNVCSQATAYLARTAGGNEGGNAVAITALICGLVTDGVIDGTLAGTTTCGSHLDALYILAQQNAADAKLNLCGTSYTLAPVGAPVFTSYAGYSSLSAANYLETNFTFHGTVGANYGLNSASYGLWSYAVIVESVPQVGCSNNTQIYDAFAGSVFYARVLNGTSGSVPTPGTKGLFVGDRPDGAHVNSYWNGASQGTFSATSGDEICSFKTGSFATSAQTLSQFHVGGSLGAALNLALYTRLRTYMTAVGVP